jgi:hypothetical protein
MASIIRIKRSTTAGDPSTLGAGELAYSSLAGLQSNGGDRLYIGVGAETNGNAANHVVIGGKYFTDMMDHVHGTLTANSVLIADANKKLDNLKVDNLDLNGNEISATDVNGNIVLTPNGSGYVQISGTNGIVIPVGTTLQRGPAVQGAIRYNSTNSQFEGYSGANWASLGGVRSVDGLTYITAEASPGISDDTLSFYTDGVLRAALDTNSFDLDDTIQVNVNSETQSTSTLTGALVVAGGVGIAKNLFVGGSLSVAGGIAFGDDVAVNGGDLYSTATTFNLLNKDSSSSGTNDGPTTVNAFLNAGSISIGASSGTTTINNSLASTGDLSVGSNVFTVAAATGNTSVAGTLGVTGATTLSSTLGVSGAVSLSSTLQTTGAASFLSTISVTGAATLSSNLNVTGNTTLTGDLAVNGGDLTTSASTFNLVNTTATTVNIAGGASAVNIGATTGTTTVKNALSVLLDADVDGNLNVDGTAQIDGATTIGATGSRSALTVYGTSVNVTGSDNSTIGVTASTGSATTLTLVASNSVGDANLDINVDDAATLDATTISLDATDSSNFSVSASSSANKTLALDVSNAGTGLGILAIGSSGTDNVNITTDASGKVTVESGELETNVATLDVNATNVTIDATGSGNSVIVTSAATTINSDSITLRGTEGSGDDTIINVTGQVNIDNIRIDGNTIYSTDGSNTLYLDPAPINDNEGTVVIKGNLQVDGTTTTVNSTVVTIDDPVFTLGGDTTPTADDNLDRGIEFRWHDGAAAKLGFMGYDDSASEFVLISDADNTAGVYSPATLGVFGNARFGKLALVDITQSTTTTNGALVVAGGVGITGQLNVAGTTNKFTSTQASTSTTTGAVVVTGGVGIGGSVYVGTNVIGAGAANSNLEGFNIDGGTY